MNMKMGMAGLTDEDKLMFANFMDWVNGLKHDKGNACFKLADNDFQKFLNDEGIRLLRTKHIPKSLRGTNVVAYVTGHSGVGDLARHIRNAFTHSRIGKKNGLFLMTDVYRRKGQPETFTMRGKVAVGLMPRLLAAIRANRKPRNRQPAR